MSERCPLLDKQGTPEAKTGDKFGAVWDSGLSELCMRSCFNPGEALANSQATVKTEVFVSEEERSLVEGDTGMGVGILAKDAVNREGYIDIDDGTDPEALLSSSSFNFICKV